MNKLTYILNPSPHPSRALAIEAVRSAQDGMVVTIQEPKRNLAQNALMWAVLTELELIDWYGNHLTKEEWKDVITASLKRQKVVPGIDGGFVVCGANTSKMSKRELAEVIEAAYAFGATHGIIFTDPCQTHG